MRKRNKPIVGLDRLGRFALMRSKRRRLRRFRADVKPYVGVGIGWASNRVNDVFVSNFGVKHDGTSSGFAWSVKGGVGVPISPALTLDLGVGYTDLGKLHSDPGSVAVSGTTVGTYAGANGKLRAWELTVGLRF